MSGEERGVGNPYIVIFLAGGYCGWMPVMRAGRI
jgi:hypothetical protein